MRILTRSKSLDGSQGVASAALVSPDKRAVLIGDRDFVTRNGVIANPPTSTNSQSS
jgi:hypothetical protein